jgi:hypothetical protein
MRYEFHLLAFLHIRADFRKYGTLTNNVTVQGKGVLISKLAILHDPQTVSSSSHLYQLPLPPPQKKHFGIPWLLQSEGVQELF